MGLLILGSGIVRADNYEQCVERSLKVRAYPDALKCLREAAASEPKSYRIAYLFGTVFIRAEQPDSAIVHLRRAVELKDDYAEAYDALGAAQMEKHNPTGAIDAFLHAIASERRSPTYASLLGLGVAYAEADSFKQSTVALSKASDLDRTQIDPYIALGDLYLKSHVYILAKEQYELALAIQPRSIILRQHLAQAFLKGSEYDSAVAQYNAVLAIDSTDKSVLSELAEIYILAHQWRNAFVVFHRLAVLEPANLEVRMKEGAAAYRAKEFADAIAPLNAVVAGATVPDSVKIAAMRWLAESYFNSNKRVEAVGAYEQLLRKDSIALTAENYKQYAGSLLETHDTAKAFQALEVYTLRDTSDCKILKLLGPRKMSLKDFTAAISFFKLQLKRCDTTVPVLKNIGSCYQALQKPDSALLWYGLVLARKPYDGWTTTNIAIIFLQKEDRDTVLTIYKDYLAHINPDSTPANELGTAYKYVGFIYLVKKEFAQAIEYLTKAQGVLKEDCDVTLWLGQSHHNMQHKEEAAKYYKDVIKRHCKNEKAATENLKLLEAKQ